MFQFTQPKRAATSMVYSKSWNLTFQFTQPKRAATSAQTQAAEAYQFQFTQPKRAATFFINLHPSGYKFQFTQPKRAATTYYHTYQSVAEFQFTQPKRAATVGNLPSCVLQSVSIHAAQAGCDTVLPSEAFTYAGFNSRSPSGLRLRVWLLQLFPLVFQFTQPKRAATVLYTCAFSHTTVSIHAAQAGCD